MAGVALAPSPGPHGSQVIIDLPQTSDGYAQLAYVCGLFA